MQAIQKALVSIIDPKYHSKLASGFKNATRSLQSFALWLNDTQNTMNSRFEVGRDNYEYFLKNIALLPYSPEELLTMGKLEWARSVSFDTYEKSRNKSEPQPTIFANVNQQIAQQKKDEEKIREGGCEAYIAKPISVGTFIDTVQRFLD